MALYASLNLVNLNTKQITQFNALHWRFILRDYSRRVGIWNYQLSWNKMAGQLGNEILMNGICSIQFAGSLIRDFVDFSQKKTQI